MKIKNEKDKDDENVTDNSRMKLLGLFRGEDDTKEIHDINE